MTETKTLTWKVQSGDEMPKLFGNRKDAIAWAAVHGGMAYHLPHPVIGLGRDCGCGENGRFYFLNEPVDGRMMQCSRCGKLENPQVEEGM